jgi:hypothetical protein
MRAGALGSIWATLCALAWGALFGLAYGQAPLYTSNQNEFLLHGLAQAGLGFLRQDWLAGTADPVPAFSALVQLTAGLLDERLFYLYFLLLAAVYLHSLWGIADRLFELSASRGRTALFLALFFVLHAAGLRIALGRFVGGSWEYLFDGGVAGHRLLGTVFQPSTFGVLLLLAVDQFLRGRPYIAAAAAGAASLLHVGYLVPSAVLVGSMLWVLYRQDRRLRRPLLAGALALAVVLPIVIYTARTFLPVSEAATQVLVQVRVPQHAVIAEWFDAAVVVKLALILPAIYAVRGRPLADLLALGTASAVLLSVAQLLSGSDSLAMLFPWRIFTYLVPAASAVLSGWGARALADRSGWTGAAMPRPALFLCLAAVAASILSGLGWSALQFAQQRADPARGALSFVQSSKLSGQVYLIPPRMQDFRLATGAPAMVEFKAIPYRADEVLDWYDRLRLAQLIYRDRPEEVNCAWLVEAAQEYGVTHVVLDEDLLALDCPGLRRLYADSHYAVAAVEAAQP